MIGTRQTTWPPYFRFLLVIQASAVTVAALYFCRPVLMPLTITVLLTFLLRPPAVWLEKRRLPRPAAVGVVALTVLVVIGSAGWVVTSQLRELALHLDEYRGHLHAKIAVLQHTRIQSFENLRALVREVAEAVETKRPSVGSAVAPSEGSTSQSEPDSSLLTSHAAGTSQQLPATINVVPESRSPWGVVTILWNSLSTPLTTLVVIGVLVLFALGEYEELRNRIYRLAGHHQLTVTTRALDEAGKRISRYLAAYAFVNCGFGVLAFAGLSILGVRYALLWGFLAATMRFLPYVGVIAGAGLPVCMAIIQFPDWTHPILVAGLFLLLEIVTNTFVEPVTYGKSAGVSTVALLVSALFWAWLWGPVGLMLSVPLTVVVAVMGKHVPHLEALKVLLTEEPALEPHISFYQRLLAGDTDDAAAVFGEYVAAHGIGETYDRLVVPALALAERDRRNGDLVESDLDAVWKMAADLVEENGPADMPAPRRPICVLGCSAEGPADDIALFMLQQMVAGECTLVIAGAEAMASEKTAVLSSSGAQAVVISDVGPGGDLQIRYLCKRLRQEAPRVSIIVGRWGYTGNIQRTKAGLRKRGADYVVTTLAEAADLISRIPAIPISA